MRTFSLFLLLSGLLSLMFIPGCEWETDRQELNTRIVREIHGPNTSSLDSIIVTIYEYVEHATLKRDGSEPGSTSDYVLTGNVAYNDLDLTPPNQESDEWTLVSDEPLFSAGQSGTIITDTPERREIHYIFDHPAWIDSLGDLPDSVVRGENIRYEIRSSDPLTLLRLADAEGNELFEGSGHQAGQSFRYYVPESYPSGILIFILRCTDSQNVVHTDASMGMTYEVVIRDTVRVVDPE